MIPYIIKANISIGEMKIFELNVENQQINPLVFLANQNVDNGIDTECMAEIDDFTFICFIDVDYINRIKKFLKEAGCPIDFINVEDYLSNNKISFIKKDDGFDERFLNYYKTKFSINNVLDKISKYDTSFINEYDKLILK